MVCLTFSVVSEKKYVKSQKGLQNIWLKVRFSPSRKAKDGLTCVMFWVLQESAGDTHPHYNRKGNELLLQHKMRSTAHSLCDLLYLSLAMAMEAIQPGRNLEVMKPRGNNLGICSLPALRCLTRHILDWLTVFPSCFSKKPLFSSTPIAKQSVLNNRLMKLKELTTVQTNYQFYVMNTAKHSTGRLPSPFLFTPRMADSYIYQITRPDS